MLLHKLLLQSPKLCLASLPSLPSLPSLLSQFSTSTPPPQKLSPQNIRNQNLKFESDDYVINMYPFYPQVFKKKDRNIYEIYSGSIVMSFIFLNKELDYGLAWENRKSVSMKFKDVGKMLSAEIQSGRQVKIQTGSGQKRKTLTIQDLRQSRKMQLTLTPTPQSPTPSPQSDLQQLLQSSSTSSSSTFTSSILKPQLQTTIPYQEYLIMYKIIENSLLDLSGWKFMMEVQKKQQLNKLENKSFADHDNADLFGN